MERLQFSCVIYGRYRSFVHYTRHFVTVTIIVKGISAVVKYPQREATH